MGTEIRSCFLHGSFTYTYAEFLSYYVPHLLAMFERVLDRVVYGDEGLVEHRASLHA